MRDLVRGGLVLAASAVVVHLTYAFAIRPRADALVEIAARAGQSAPRDWSVILMGWEQEICLILLVFSVVQIVVKLWALTSEQYLFGVDLLAEYEGGELPLAETLDQIEALPGDMGGTQLMEALSASLRRYRITGDVQNTSDAIQTSVDALGMRLEADNAMLRYIVWAIPSIGFVGTVRGIGQAVSRADEALAGDITGMTASLGLAFNSTLVALVASLLLMLLLHVLNRAQDRRLIDIQGYCEEFLLKRISR